MTRAFAGEISFPCEAGAAFAAMDELLIETILEPPATARPLIVGLGGPQGSGKSSTLARLSGRMAAQGIRIAALSLDDFYLPRRDRAVLAANIHPLLATRGVPGTHDIALLNRTIDGLIDADRAARIACPQFDKLADERMAREHWLLQPGSPHAIIIEGWCVGARPQPGARLAHAVNELEAREDPDGRWRSFVNDHLATGYADLFARLDYNMLLKYPDFDCVLGWRREQELGLARLNEDGHKPMSDDELHRFIAHYERLTRWMMEDEPADLVIEIGKDRVPIVARPPAPSPQEAP